MLSVILSWFFGLSFAFSAITSLIRHELSMFLAFFIISLFILPPSVKKIEKTTNLKVTTATKFFVFIVSIVFLASTNTNKALKNQPNVTTNAVPSPSISSEEAAALKHKEEEVKKIQQKNTKENEARIARFGNPPTQSGWDSSYHVVKNYLKSVANDPESIEMDGCTSVQYDSNAGWVVGCKFFGKNAFGGKIRNFKWFVIKSDTVISVKDAEVYK